MKAIIMMSIALASGSSFAANQNTGRGLASIRVDHARELMGSGYKKSVVSRGEKIQSLEKRIFETVKKRLPARFKKDSHKIAHAIVTESLKHELDPYFVMAVISGESSFNPEAVGPVGEIGMMQIRLTTGAWIAKKMKISWQGEKSLRNPVSNIRIGTAYLSYLRQKFSRHGQLYLAAYNMGATSVKRALGRNVWPKDYPRHVMKRYIAFYKEL